ncbi:MAG: rRNA pseudouridine synthase [Oscillospiraceae bacterium]|nr:rRNA pseudouridine synthase [Oscillospiraceae bacterium]MBQ2145726.1 rRNA pseudouridine synthase [Oscillospiraceae bacterium]
MKERLQKLLSQAGVASRRASEKLIEEGRVTVNGSAASLGDCADFETDEICVDGKKISAGEKKVYVLLNKPKGYVTTLRDEKNRKCVTDLLTGLETRVYPVGRLDINSEGLLILTNDGDFAYRMTHPSKEVRKVYEVSVTGENIASSLEMLALPILVDGVYVTAKDIKVVSSDGKSAVLDITIGEGRNREIRRMCNACDLYVRRLVRIKEGNLELGELKPGRWRYLKRSEIANI